MKHFIAGFCLSLFSVSLTGHLCSSTAADKLRELPKSNIKINLFKTQDTPALSLKNDLFAEIKKESINPQAKVDRLLSSAETEISYDEVNGIEDDEILRVNVDDIIPIDFIDSSAHYAEVTDTTDDHIVALLPSSPEIEEESAANSPWVIAKSAKNIKNKRFAEQMKEEASALSLTDTFKEQQEKDKEISHKVAEKIKQSIIFPIPDEILNDENLTPTFISGNKKKKDNPNTAKSAKKAAPMQQKKESPAPGDVKIINKVSSQDNNTQEDNSGLLDSISSWFTNKPTKQEKTTKTQSRPAPSYSSQGAPVTKNINNDISDTDEFVKFYETLQNTSREHEENKILPTELKLSFQPGRAEISGQTLHWLKSFSDTTKDGKSRLQVRLDPNTPIELQRKRLSLLYTIFTNNGVDLNQVDTVFSLNEPNAFIIRTLKSK